MIENRSGGSIEALALVKFFSEEKHFLWFKDGYSIFRTPHYYRMCEDAGRGDKSESCIGYWDRALGDDIPQMVIKGKSTDVSNINSLMLYPPHEQTDSWMQSWCLVGKSNNFELSLSKMLDEFGCYFAVLPAQNIENYAALIRQSSGLNVNYGFIRYSGNPLERSLLVKDEAFEYQKEFRFYVGKCDKQETQDKELRIKGMSNLLNEAKSLKFTSPTGDVRYCALGCKEVVIAE